MSLPIPASLQEQAVIRRLLEDSSLLFVALRSDGTLAWLSESCRTVLGWAPEDLVGHQMGDYVHPDDVPAVTDTLAEAARGAWDRVSMVVRLRRFDDTYRHIEFGGLDLRDEAGVGLLLVWGRSYESTSRLGEFMAALAAHAPLAELEARVAAWLEAGIEGSVSVARREPDGGFVDEADAPDGGPPPLRLARFVPGDAPDAPWEEAIERIELAVAPDLTTLPPNERALAEARGVQAVWAVPIVAAHGPRADAVVVVWRNRPGGPLATHRRRLATAAQFVRLALDWDASHRALVTAATTDPLTGLANRSQLAAAIDADRSSLSAVLFCDLDDFKVVNDRFGHLVGDQVLGEVARRLATAVRGGDVLARIGGDEFAVHCPALRDAVDAELVADRIVAVLDVPIEAGGSLHRIGASVGVAVVAREDRARASVEELLGLADRALYRAKEQGKGRWVRAGAWTDPELPFPT